MFFLCFFLAVVPLIPYFRSIQNQKVFKSISPTESNISKNSILVFRIRFGMRFFTRTAGIHITLLFWRRFWPSDRKCHLRKAKTWKEKKKTNNFFWKKTRNCHIWTIEPKEAHSLNMNYQFLVLLRFASHGFPYADEKKKWSKIIKTIMTKNSEYIYQTFI